MTLRALRHGGLFVCSMALLGACGGDDDKKVSPDPESDGGEPAVVSYPPAIGPEDCNTSIENLKLSQPEGAAVWGGLVVLTFETEGAPASAFQTQLFDPSLGIWVNAYAQTSGQRDDGSYLLAITPSTAESNLDKQLKVRLRPSQEGCPEREWVESETFSASDPVAGTSWKAVVPAALFNNKFTVQRFEAASEQPAVLPSTRAALGDASVELTFGEDGELSQTVTLPFVADKGEPFAGCRFVLTFEGTYSLIVRNQYGSLTLAISDLSLTSYSGSECAFPALETLSLANETQSLLLPAYTQSFGVSYLPLLYEEPGVPMWENSSVAQVFQQLPQFFNYVTKNERGSLQGYVYPQELVLEKQ
jgi:hypothetical protein